MRWQLQVERQTGTRELRNVNTNVRNIYIDVISGEFVRDDAPAELTDRAQWLDQQTRSKNTGDLCYDVRQDAFVAVSGAKLAVLDAASWIDADKVPLSELRKLIRDNGQATASLSRFVVLNPQSQIGGRQVKPTAPSLVVQTLEGAISIVRVSGMSVGGLDLPEIRLRQRPLAPNLPIHPGDVPDS